MSQGYPAVAVGDWNSGGTNVFAGTGLETSYIVANGWHQHDHAMAWGAAEVINREEASTESDGYFLTDHPIVLSSVSLGC